jgi:hypothetical protein
MCRRAFVRLNRLSVPAKYRKQGRKRQNDQDFAADTIDLLPIHGVVFSFSVSSYRFCQFREDFAPLAILPRPATVPKPPISYRDPTGFGFLFRCCQIQMLPGLAHPFVFRRTHIVQ